MIQIFCLNLTKWKYRSKQDLLTLMYFNTSRRDFFFGFSLVSYFFIVTFTLEVFKKVQNCSNYTEIFFKVKNRQIYVKN